MHKDRTCPLEALQIGMAGAHILCLQVLELAVDVEAVLQGRHGVAPTGSLAGRSGSGPAGWQTLLMRNGNSGVIASCSCRNVTDAKHQTSAGVPYFCCLNYGALTRETAHTRRRWERAAQIGLPQGWFPEAALPARLRQRTRAESCEVKGKQHTGHWRKLCYEALNVLWQTGE